MGSALSRHVVIVGAMGVGKTTIGDALARRLGRPFVDSDMQIRERTGEEGSAIAASRGVEVLHTLEREVLTEALASSEPMVIAAAASVIEDPVMRKSLAGPIVVWLHADGETLLTRQERSGHRRRLAPDEVSRVADREPLYRSVADRILDTAQFDIDDAVATLAAELSEGDPDG